MNHDLIVSVSPHYHKKGATTQRIMLDVLIALVPALIASILIFGVRSLLLVAVSAANCMLLEFLWNKLFKKEQTISDLSAVVTGVLIAYNVPVSMPIWQLLIGDFIAIIIVKMLFGGLGCNFVNPALVGRLSMMLSFTESMTDYLSSADVVSAATVDALSSATPLSVIDEIGMGSFETLLFGTHGGVLGETCAIALILGGIYLVVRGVIKITIPVCFIGSTFVFTFLFNGFNATSAFLSLFAGGLMLGSIFMATDYVTSPLTTKGRVIFAVGCGFFTSAIRVFANSAEGVSYAILLMNLLVSYINEGCRTKPVGGAKA
jgi:Na+-translocating ferredoxin:NAD+ oxidoreductase subunit D